jgi:hypothetical protein
MKGNALIRIRVNFFEIETHWELWPAGYEDPKVYAFDISEVGEQIEYSVYPLWFFFAFVQCVSNNNSMLGFG